MIPSPLRGSTASTWPLWTGRGRPEQAGWGCSLHVLAQGWNLPLGPEHWGFALILSLGVPASVVLSQGRGQRVAGDAATQTQHGHLSSCVTCAR